MKLGFVLPHMGSPASPDAIIRVATRAEELGYDSLWVTDRLLYPVEPQTPFAGIEGMPWPEVYKTVLNPLQTLTFAAAHTSHIGLGTSILVMPNYNPVQLAQHLTTLDVLSGGRLTVGLGQGWAKDEYDATGASMENRAARADEFIQVLKTIWTTNPAEFHGDFFQVPKSIIQPKPVQKPHPPIYLAAFSPGAMKRVAALANGWNPTGIPINDMFQMMDGIREMAQQAGRNPSELKMVVRANLFGISDTPMGEQRQPFNGSLAEIKADIVAAEKLGADELFFDPGYSPAGATAEGYLSVMKQIKELVT